MANAIIKEKLLCNVKNSRIAVTLSEKHFHLQSYDLNNKTENANASKSHL